MEFTWYWNIIKKRLVWMIAITLITGILSAIINVYFIKDVYESSLTLYVGKSKESSSTFTYQDLQAGELIVKDCMEIVKSRMILFDVMHGFEQEEKDNKNLKKALGVSYEQFSSKISAEMKAGTRVIEFKVRDGDPKVSALIANKLGDVFVEKATELLKVENARIIDMAVVPNNHVQPKRTQNILLSMIASTFLAILLAMGIEYFDNTIKTDDDIKQESNIPVLGVIPTIDLLKMKKKCHECSG